MLEAHAHAEAIQDLIADPFAVAGVDLQRRQEPGTDRHNAASDDCKGGVVSDLLGGDATENGRGDHREHQRKESEA